MSIPMHRYDGGVFLPIEEDSSRQQQRVCLVTQDLFHSMLKSCIFLILTFIVLASQIQVLRNCHQRNLIYY